MVIYKRKKIKRMRGNKTHGWGAMKKHRGSGNKGGVGNAGSGKRADSKKPSYWDNPLYFGKHGFSPKNSVTYKPVNIGYFEDNSTKLIAQGKMKTEADSYVVNLKELGFNKLLSQGSVSKKLVITTPYASLNAIEKIKSKGGNVLGLLPKKEKKHKKEEGKGAKKQAVDANEE